MPMELEPNEIPTTYRILLGRRPRSGPIGSGNDVSVKSAWLGPDGGVSLVHVQGSKQEAHRKDEQAQAHAEGKEAQEARQEGQVEPQAPSAAAWAPPRGSCPAAEWGRLEDRRSTARYRLRLPSRGIAGTVRDRVPGRVPLQYPISLPTQHFAAPTSCSDEGAGNSTRVIPAGTARNPAPPPHFNTLTSKSPTRRSMVTLTSWVWRRSVRSRRASPMRRCLMRTSPSEGGSAGEVSWSRFF